MKKISKIVSLSLLSLSLIGCSRQTSSNVSSEAPTSDRTSSKASTSKESSTSSSKASTSSSSSSSTIYDTTKWSNDVVDAMLKYLGNQLIPYLKLSSKEKNVVTTWTTSTTLTTDYYLLIEGDLSITDSFISDAINTYKSAGWTITAQTSIEFTATLESAKLKVVVAADSYGYPSIKAFYDEPYDATTATAWNQDVLDIFNNYCDGHQVPFFYMGTANAWAGKWTSSTNQGYIYGNKNYCDEIVDNAKTVLTSDDGWTTTEGTYSSQKSLTAEKTFEDGCKISLTLQCANATSKRPRLLVKFTERFDTNDYSAWDSYVASIFQNYYDNHSIPVIYLGSQTVTASFSDSTYVLTLTGGLWNDLILSNTKTVLDADKNSAGTSYWTIQEGNDTYGATLTATRTNYDDGCAISFVISRTSAAATGKAKMVISYIPKIDVPSTSNAWSSDVQTKLATKVSKYSDLLPLDGHELPYIYLNTTSETATVSFNTTSRSVSIAGGTYNPNIIKNAISTYTTAGWTVDKLENPTYSNNIGFKAVKQFSHTTTTGEDHPCEITVTIAAPTSATPLSSKMTLKAYLKEGFGLNEYTDYDQDIKDDLKDYFNNFDLPVFYLGSNVLFNSMTAATKTEVLSGGSWDDSLFTTIKTQLQQDTGEDGTSRWTITDPVSTDTTPKLKASCEDGDDGTVKIEFYKYVPSTSTYPYAYGLPYMKVQYVNKVDEDATGSWSSTVTDAFKNVFTDANVNVVPYTNLNAESSAITATSSTSYNYVSLTGGSWDDTVLTLAKTKYEADNWDCSIDRGSASKRFIAIKELDDGSYFKVAIYSSSTTIASAKCIMYINYYPAVTIPTSSTDWSTANKTLMSTWLNGNYLPYFYTNKTEAKFVKYENTSYGYSNINSTSTTAAGDVQIGLNAQDALEKDGWTTSFNWNYSTVYYGYYQLNATKKVTGGKLKFKMYNYSKTKAYMYAYFVKDLTLDSTTSYTLPNDSNNRLLSLFGTKLPNIYIGLGNPYETFSYTNGTCKFYGKGYSDTLASDAKALFDADNTQDWDTEIVDVDSNPQYSSINGSAEGNMLIASTTTTEGTVFVYVYQYCYSGQYEYPIIDVRLVA